MQKRNILFIEQEIPHYRAGVLKAISDEIDAEFQFFHGKTSNSQAFIEPSEFDLPKNTSFVFVRWVLGERLVLHNYWAALRKVRNMQSVLVVVRHNPRSIFLLPFMLWCRLTGRKVVVWGQGFSRKRDFRPKSHPLDMLNLAIAKLANAYVAYSAEIKDRLSNYVDNGKLFVGFNTLNLSGLNETRKRLVSESKIEVRNRLGLKSKYYIVFIGRLQKRKKIDLFIETLVQLQQKHKMDIGGIIIGHGPEECSLRKLADETSVRDLHFTGGLNLEESSEFLFASDVLFMPGWLGLAVNHAFFFGLPIVGRKWDDKLSNHGPEAAYIVEGENGILVDARYPGELISAIQFVVDRKDEMGMKARSYFERYLDISRMVEGFREAFNYVMPEKQDTIENQKDEEISSSAS